VGVAAVGEEGLGGDGVRGGMFGVGVGERSVWREPFGG